jgi:predicted RND superfamily exporter protein
VFDRLARLLLRYPRLAALLLAGIVLCTSAGASRLVADFSIVAFFSAGDQEKIELDVFKAFWGEDVAAVMIVAQAEDGDMFTEARLDWVTSLTERLQAETDSVERVLSLATVPPLLGDEPGLLDLEPALSQMPRGDSEAMASWRSRLLASPVLVPHLVSRDGSVTAIVAEITGNPDDPRAVKPRVEALRAVMRAVPPPPGVTATAAGIPAIRADFFDVIFEDQRVMVPLVAAAMGLLLFLLFRRVHALAAAGLAALLPPLMVFGIMGFVGEPLGIMNQTYFTLLPVIAIADAIHMISRFHEEARKLAPGQDFSPELRRAAVRRAVATIGFACLLTSLTTSVGFLSLISANMPVLRSFGAFAALGILFAYGTVLLVIPLVLSHARGPVPAAPQNGWATRTLGWCADLALNRSWAVLGVTAAVLACSLFFGTRVVVDNYLTGMLPESHETTRASRIVDESLGGMLSLELDIQGAEDALLDPVLLQALLDAGDEALALDSVRSVTGPATLVAALHQAATGRREIPQAEDAVLQFLSLIDGSEALSFVMDSDSWDRGRLVLRTKDLGAIGYVALCDRIRGIFDRHLSDSDGVDLALTGTAWVAYRGINGITYDLRNSLALAFVFVTLTILVLLRDLRLAVLCIVPNLLPLVVGYGVMGMAGWLLDPTPAVVFTIALGIAVDDTIHMMARYREERALGVGHRQAIRNSVIHTGRPVAITSIILCTGFLANVTSSFPTMQVMGMLGAVVIFVALLSDLFVLPALLALFAKPDEDGFVAEPSQDPIAQVR